MAACKLQEPGPILSTGTIAVVTHHILVAITIGPNYGVKIPHNYRGLPRSTLLHSSQKLLIEQVLIFIRPLGGRGVH